MKRYLTILYLLLFILGTRSLYAQNEPIMPVIIDGKLVWGDPNTKNNVIDSWGELVLDSDVEMVNVVRIPEGKTLKITSTKNITIKNASIGQYFGDKNSKNEVSSVGRSRMFTVKGIEKNGTEYGKLIIQAPEGYKITLDGGKDNDRKLSEAISNEGILELKNVIIQNVDGSDDNGGAIRVILTANSTLLDNCTIQNCKTKNSGGAIHVNTQGTLKLQNCTIINCESTAAGGGIYLNINNEDETEFKECAFTNCTAGGNGGGIYLLSNHITKFDKCHFNTCKSINNNGEGGGIYISSTGQTNFNECEFIKCETKYLGGAIKKNSSGTILFKNGKIEECKAQLGSAIMITGSGTVTVEDFQINKCISGGGEQKNSGGAIRTYGSVEASLNLTRVVFSENKAKRNVGWNKNIIETHANGGALFWNARGTENTKCVINGCTFTKNTSEDNGGAIKSQGTLVFDGAVTEITENIAPVGAGLYIEGYQGGAVVSGKHTINYDLNNYMYIHHNNAISYTDNNGTSYTGHGAGVHLHFGPEMDLEKESTINLNMNGAIIEYNKATGNGGGIYFENTSDEVENGADKKNYTFNINLNYGSILNNNAANGAGVYVYKGSVKYDKEKNYSNTLSIANNTSSNNGGGIYVREGDIEIEKGSIYNNTATSGYGGGIYVDGGEFKMGSSTATNNNSMLISNNYSSNDGGGVYMNGGNFYQYSGSITNNYNTGDGGGVCIVEGGSFIMYGGNINSNGSSTTSEVKTLNGGGVYLNGGNFTLTDGKIEYNKARNNGGGVFLTGNECNYTLSKGDIINNTATNGGGVYLQNGLFTLGNTGNEDDGNISKNIAARGGGVYIGSENIEITSEGENSSSGFMMLGGTIKENRAENENLGEGGGVYLNGGNLKVEDGLIYNNFSTNYGGGIYILNGEVNMNEGKVSENICGLYGGGVYVYNSTDNNIKINFTGGTLYKNEAHYGGGICVNGKIELSIGNIEIVENIAKNGGGVCLMNNAYMKFGAGQIKYNIAKKSETNDYYENTTAHNKDITEVEGIGGGVYLNTNTRLEFESNKENPNLGLFGNTADNGADELFANGKSTTVNIPDVTDMKLDGYTGAGNLKWIEDYIKNDDDYLSGTNLLNYTENDFKTNKENDIITNLRYREMIALNKQEIPHLEAGIEATDTRANKYICFALGYEIIYITITKTGLQIGESAIFTLSKEGAVPFRLIMTGTGQPSVSKRVAVTAGTWTITESNWSWSYDKSPSSITQNVADDNKRLFEFSNSKKNITKLPLHHESSTVNTMGF